jgi:uncharacterized membrane protein
MLKGVFVNLILREEKVLLDILIKKQYSFKILFFDIYVTTQAQIIGETKKMAVVALVLFSSLFAITHIGLSCDPFRQRLIDKLGNKVFMVVYSLIALIAIGPAIAILINVENTGPQLWEAPFWCYPIVHLLMLLAILMLILSFANPSPTGMMPASMEVRGVLRITRHPMNMGFAFFGLAHLIAGGSLGEIFFFGSFFVVGFLGAYLQDRKVASEKGEPFAKFADQTSVFPFAALITGKNHLEIGEISKPIVLVSLAVYIAAIFLH